MALGDADKLKAMLEHPPEKIAQALKVALQFRWAKGPDIAWRERRWRVCYMWGHGSGRIHFGDSVSRLLVTFV